MERTQQFRQEQIAAAAPLATSTQVGGGGVEGGRKGDTCSGPSFPRGIALARRGLCDAPQLPSRHCSR